MDREKLEDAISPLSDWMTAGGVVDAIFAEIERQGYVIVEAKGLARFIAERLSALEGQ